MSYNKANQANYLPRWVGVGLIVLVIGGAIYALFPQKSNYVKYTECTKSADEVYDSSRRTITANANGYSPEEQQIYYQRTADGYKQDLQSCRELYPN